MSDHVLRVHVGHAGVENPFVAEAVVGLAVGIFVAHGPEFLEACLFVGKGVAAPELADHGAYRDLHANVLSFAASLTLALTTYPPARFDDASSRQFV